MLFTTNKECFDSFTLKDSSNVLKMHEDKVYSAERRVNIFPSAFNHNFTPYSKLDFGEKTKKVCADFNNFTTNCLLNLKICKVIILGDLCVGKTSILNRFCHKMFETDYKSTIGVDFQTEELSILGTPFHLQIWDTAGQERFKCIAQCYYRRAHVFELSTIKTLASCKNWLREAMEAGHNSETPYIFLVGTKKDLLSQQAYKSAEEIASETAKNLGAEFWSVSSKTGENIDELFYRAAGLVFDDHIQEASEKFDKSGIAIGTELISFKNVCKSKSDKKKKNRCNGLKCANDRSFKSYI